MTNSTRRRLLVQVERHHFLAVDVDEVHSLPSEPSAAKGEALAIEELKKIRRRSGRDS